MDTYEVSEEGTRSEIERMALPFAVGDEVLVAIEEPHMYEADDAIARVDSYIVSVNGGGKFVGERRLVRIDAVARSQATASLVDNGSDNGAEEAEGAASDGERESSRLRSRGGEAAEARRGTVPARRTDGSYTRRPDF